jgi:hypothetical protein
MATVRPKRAKVTAKKPAAARRLSATARKATTGARRFASTARKTTTAARRLTATARKATTGARRLASTARKTTSAARRPAAARKAPASALRLQSNGHKPAASTKKAKAPVRHSWLYELRNGPEVVYYGVAGTREPGSIKRSNASKAFSQVNVLSLALTRASAMKREMQQVKQYQKQHGGKPPKYNTRVPLAA